MRLMNTNFCDQAQTVVTCSTADSNFPVSNLKNQFRSKRLRSTDVNNTRVVFDIQTAEPIDSVILLWPKEDGIKLSNTAVVKIQANATNVWTSPALDVTLTVDNLYEMATNYFTSDQSYRYWSVLIQDASNPNGFIELGKVWLGKSIQIENAQNGFSFTLADRTKHSITDFGNDYADIYPLFASLNFSYQNMDYASVVLLENAYRQNRSAFPVMVVFDPAELVFTKNQYAIYGKFQTSFVESHITYNLFNVNGITITESA